MTRYQVQFPVFVQRAISIASLHTAYQRSTGPTGSGAGRLGARLMPLSVVAPEPKETDWHGCSLTVARVTCRFPESWQARVFLRKPDHPEAYPQAWSLLRIDSIFRPLGGHNPAVFISEGRRLYEMCISYGLTLNDLAWDCTGGHQEPLENGGCVHHLGVRMPNGDHIHHRQAYVRIDGQLHPSVSPSSH